MLFGSLKPKPKCWLFHRLGEWKPITNPAEHITPAMYRCGVAPTHIRTCDCGAIKQLTLEEWQ